MTRPDISPEFAVFRDGFLEAVLDACDIPEDERELWRDLR